MWWDSGGIKSWIKSDKSPAEGPGTNCTSTVCSCIQMKHSPRPDLLDVKNKFFFSSRMLEISQPSGLLVATWKHQLIFLQFVSAHFHLCTHPASIQLKALSAPAQRPLSTRPPLMGQKARTPADFQHVIHHRIEPITDQVHTWLSCVCWLKNIFVVGPPWRLCPTQWLFEDRHNSGN